MRRQTPNRRKEAGGGGRKAATRQGAQLRKWRGGRNGRCWLLAATVLPQSYLRPAHQYLAVRESTGRGVGVCTSSFSPKMWNFRVIFITLVVLAGVPNILAYVEVRICQLLLLFETKLCHFVG